MSNIIVFIRQIFSGKSIYRILFNKEVSIHCAGLKGSGLDLAGSREASYYRFLPANIEVVKGNITTKGGVDKQIDFNVSLPFGNESFDFVLFFNAIYIAEDPVLILKEISRVLKPGGKLFLASPFISNEMPEPHDYQRFTSEGLNKLFSPLFFSSWIIYNFGERFSSSSYLLHPVFYFNIVRLTVYSLALIGDRLIPKGWRRNYPTPLGYFVVAKK